MPDGLYTFNVSCQYISTRASRATAWHTQVKLNFDRLDHQQACHLPSEAHGYRECLSSNVFGKIKCAAIFSSFQYLQHPRTLNSVYAELVDSRLLRNVRTNEIHHMVVFSTTLLPCTKV